MKLTADIRENEYIALRSRLTLYFKQGYIYIIKLTCVCVYVFVHLSRRNTRKVKKKYVLLCKMLKRKTKGYIKLNCTFFDVI